MKNTYLLWILLLLPLHIQAQKVPIQFFELINLNYPGLGTVKEAVKNNKSEEAMKSLLDYYRNREGINHPDINLNKIKVSDWEKKIAKEGLQHQFFVHKGYQPSFFYGKEIDWQHWPVEDNELRWQLHRTKWWQPMGKVYKTTGDEKYAQEWVFQFLDWIQKNPLLPQPTAEEKELLTPEELKLWKNVRFAWRPLEVSHRLQDQTIQFLLFKDSPYFTPSFLSYFLTNYATQAEHILNNYSKEGNHLLFEAQRMIYAGTFFPEFKEASNWRKSGIEVLNREIKKQVYPDGMHYELDPHYHLAAINIFAKAIRVADTNGFRDEFDESYLCTVEQMILWVINCHLPNYSNPMFSDAKLDDKESMLRNYKQWQTIFPNNEAIQYMATERKEGNPPQHLSKAFKHSGYYVFRSGWDEMATQMTLKAGPPAFWHNQPDNGTFELYSKGRNFFPDSGSYVYAGNREVNQERAWFKQTRVHQTLTLNNKNLTTMDTKCLLWDAGTQNDILVIENPSYTDLRHRRSVFFVDKTFFVLVDEAIGEATGDIDLHFQFCEGRFTADKTNHTINSQFDDNNNIVVKTFANSPIELREEEGWVSYAYRQKTERTAYAMHTVKKERDTVRFITIIFPTEQPIKSKQIKAKLLKTDSPNQLKLQVNLKGKRYNLEYNLK